MSPAGLSAVHHDATQSVFGALWTLLRQGTVRATVLLNHLTWGRGWEGMGGEGMGGEGMGGEGRGSGGDGRVGITVCKVGLLG